MKHVLKVPTTRLLKEISLTSVSQWRTAEPSLLKYRGIPKNVADVKHS